jgi:TP901 family phage tail tape measure protein
MSTGNLRVRLLLDLVNRMSPQAKAARKDLQGVGQEAKQLQGVRGPDKLNASLKVTSQQAAAAQAAMAKARAEAKALANTSAKPKGLEGARQRLGGFANRRATGGGRESVGKTAAAEAAGGLSAGQGAAAGAVAAGARGMLMRAAPVLAPGLVGGASIKTFAELEVAERELAVTTDQTDAAVRSATDSFRKQAGVLGETGAAMVGTAQKFAASGMNFDTSVASVVPTVRTAKAAFADMNDVATSGIAVMQNLKVPVRNLQEVYDRMAFSAKSGQVEMKNLASELPAALASYSKVGYGGLKGLSDITTQMQIMRRSTSSAAEASNRLQNLYEKVTSDETIKGFKKLGVNLEAELKKGEKAGESMIDTVVRLTDKVARDKKGGLDPFKLNTIAGDMQFRAALLALVNARKELSAERDKNAKSAAGTVERDFTRASSTMQAEFAKLSAAWNTTMARMGQALAPLSGAIAKSLSAPLEKVNEALEKLNDETRSGPMERAGERAAGEEAARRQFETNVPREGDEVINRQMRENGEWFGATIKRLFGMGEGGARDTDLQREHATAYQLEMEKRMQAMERAAAEKLGEAFGLRQAMEAQPETAASRTPRGKAARGAALNRAMGDELNANEDVRRAQQFRAGKERDAAEVRQMSADLKALTITLGARKIETGQVQARSFVAKPGSGAAAQPGDVGIGNLGKGSGLQFGIGGPIAQDILQSLKVEMKPAGELISGQLADGLKAGQGQTDGAAQQIGEGVKQKLSSVEAASAGQKVAADFAAGITAGGGAAVAAAEAVAAKVKSVFANAGGGAGGGGRFALQNVLSSAQHDGIA